LISLLFCSILEGLLSHLNEHKSGSSSLNQKEIVMSDTTKTSADSASESAREEPTDFELMCGTPLLLKGESRAAYDFLRWTVADLLAPTDLFGELRVQEVTDSIWEGRRFKRFATRLIDTGHITALEVLLQTAFWSSPFIKPGLIALDYYHGDTKEKREAAKQFVASAGITDDLIQAKALGVIAGEFSNADHLVDNRALKLKGLLRDHERQKRNAEKAQRRKDPKSGANDNNDNAGSAELRAVGTK
jgi:hypothetical protein